MTVQSDDLRAGVGAGAAPGLEAVPDALAACGYTELAAAFHAWDPAESRVGPVASLDHPLRAAAELLMMGRTVALDRLPEAIVRVLPALERSGVCTADGGSVHLHGLALFRVHGAWLLAHAPRPSPTLYFGLDSAALADRLDTRSGRALDLCAGPGVQSLVCAGRGMQVVAVEVNPVAAALCSVNVALNDLSSRVSVRCGDLYAEVEDERQRFDLICANPPLLPIPAGLPYPFVGDGGPDGLQVTWRILDGLDRHLTGSGHAQLIGMTLSDGFLPLVLDRLRRWCAASRFDLTWTTVNHLATTVDSSWVQGVGATSAVHAGHAAPDEIEVAQRALADGYAALGASHVCTYFMRLARGRGQVTYIDVSASDGSGDLWYG